MGSGEPVPLEAALVRVWRGDLLMGAGFLAGPAHVLTAAHVVTDALGLGAEEVPAADRQVTVDFPLLAPERRQAAEVVAWGQDADVAGLRLLGAAPGGARPLVLRRRRSGLNGLLVMVGFPRGLELGTWVYGREGGLVATGWVEIESDPTRQAVLAPGFSGTPVWSPDADAVVGMVGYKVSGAGSKIGYMMPVDTLLGTWPDLEQVIEQRSPFRALRSFTEQDAELFYGRDELAAQIVERICDAVPVISVIGGSGAGKSSLWHAGVVPRLRAQQPRLLVVTLRPSDAGTPLNALAFALDTLLEPDREVSARLESVAELASRLARGAMSDVVAAVLDFRAADRMLICVDQFEEVFGWDVDERALFARALSACLAAGGSRLSVLINLRDTFLGAVLSDQSAAELARRWLPVTVGEMTEAELRQVMTGPLKRVGTVEFADGLVERILEDLRRTPSPLPLLEFTLAELWERRSAGRLTHEAYEQVGGISRALAGYADRVWASLDPATQATAERLLVQLARPLHRDELTVRRTALRDECDDAQWAVAQRLATTRLLVLHEVNTGRPGQKPVPGVELAHDSLLTRWDRLRTLTERFRDFRVWQDGLRQRIDTWSSQESAGSRLLSGADLRDARRWEASHGDHLSARERSFISASRRRRRWLRSGVAVVLAVAVTIATAIYQHRSGQVAEAIAKDLAVKARQLHTADSFGATQLAMRAHLTDSSASLDAAEPLAYDVADKLLPHHDAADSLDTTTPAPSSAATAPTTGASSGPSGPSSTAQTQAKALESNARTESGALSQESSADGRTLVTTDASSRIALWHLSDGGVREESLSSLFGPNDYAGSPVISRSGRYVVFKQMVGFGDLDVNDADENGLPKIHPDDYATCVPESLLSITNCLVVYDTLEHKVASAREVAQVPVIGNVTMSIDPTDRILGMVVSDSVFPTLQNGLHNTLYLFDLHTGRLLREDKLPWPSLVTELWLGPGGKTATVSEVLADDVKARADLSLSFVDLGGDTVVRHQLVADPPTLDSVAMSLDGDTVAALVKDSGDGTRGLVAWSTRTGKVTARMPRLVKSGDFSTLALDASGDAAWISTLTQGYGNMIGSTGTPTDMQVEPIVGPTLNQRVSVRSLSSGKESGRFDYSGGWIWPLGSGTGAPLALVDGSTLGVVLARPGEPEPLRRLAAADADPKAAKRKLTMSGLCSLLGEPNHDKATRDLVPDGAYKGDLCHK